MGVSNRTRNLSELKKTQELNKMKIDPLSILSENEVAPFTVAFQECEETVDIDKLNALKGMLICGYIMLIVPFFPLLGAFLRRKESNHVWGSNLPGVCALVAGCLYLAWYYTEVEDVVGDVEKFNKIFKSFVALSLVVTLFGVLALIHLLFAFLGNILCSKFGSGDRLVGLFTFIFMLIVLAFLIAAPAAATGLGWKYAFGPCEEKYLSDMTLFPKKTIQ